MDTQLWITVVFSLVTVALHLYTNWLDHREKVEAHFKLMMNLISRYSLIFLTVLNVGMVVYTLIRSPWPLSRFDFGFVVLGVFITSSALLVLLLGLLAKGFQKTRSQIAEQRQVVFIALKVCDVILNGTKLTPDERKLLAASTKLALEATEPSSKKLLTSEAE